MRHCRVCDKDLPIERFQGTRKVCNACLYASRRANASKDHRVYLGIALSQAKKRSKKRGYDDFSLTLDELCDIWSRQDGKCALSGIIMTHHLDSIGARKDFNASIDRIDPTKGYVRQNVQLVATRVNVLKSDLDESQLYWWVKALWEQMTANE